MDTVRIWEMYVLDQCPVYPGLHLSVSDPDRLSRLQNISAIGPESGSVYDMGSIYLCLTPFSLLMPCDGTLYPPTHTHTHTHRHTHTQTHTHTDVQFPFPYIGATQCRTGSGVGVSEA